MHAKIINELHRTHFPAPNIDSEIHRFTACYEMCWNVDCHWFPFGNLSLYWTVVLSLKIRCYLFFTRCSFRSRPTLITWIPFYLIVSLIQIHFSQKNSREEKKTQIWMQKRKGTQNIKRKRWTTDGRISKQTSISHIWPNHF